MLRVVFMDKPQETLKSIDSPDSDPRHNSSASGRLPRPHQLIITQLQSKVES